MPAAGGYWPLCTHHFGPPWLSCNHASLPRLEGEKNGEGRPSTRPSHHHPTPLTQSFQFPPEYSRPEILLALRQKPRGDWPAAPSMAGPLRKERKGDRARGGKPGVWSPPSQMSQAHHGCSAEGSSASGWRRWSRACTGIREAR